MFIDAAFAGEWAQFPSSVFFIEVAGKDGRPGIGTGFHLGRGLVATARHVIEGQTIKTIGRHDMSLKTSLDYKRRAHHTTSNQAFKYTGPFKVFGHPDPKIDVSIVQMTQPVRGFGRIEELGPSVSLADDVEVLSQGELILTSVVVAGYPPIMHADDAYLVMIRADISAVFTHRESKKRGFVLSGMARGGFSGGPVFLIGNPRVQSSAYDVKPNAGRIIGMISESIDTGATSTEVRPEELGFMAATSIDRLKETITAHDLSV